MNGFYILTDLNDLSFVVENKLSVAIPTNAKAFHDAMKEVRRDGYPYYGGAIININDSDFQIFYYNESN